jgi:small redox-active disulfide protein 2
MGLLRKKKENRTEEKVTMCSCGNLSVGTDYEAMVSGSVISGPKTGKTLSIKILGSGCKNCQTLLQNTKDAVSAMKIPAEIEYITDMKKIAQYGVMSMPALVVGGQVVSMGKVLKASDIQKLLNNADFA